MSKHFFALAFALGLAAVAWVGLGFIGTSWLALAVTVLIAAVYAVGALELRHFRAATRGLHVAVDSLSQPPASLAEWLDRVPAPLRNAVRARVEGERAGLPGPGLTPYLVGLLVMLGMLGTFLGMVVTFKGAVFALEGSTDLQAIRAALAEPIRGLGLSFGTSVAGVAASAMLGLMSAVSRRERVDAVRALDGRIATVLQPFSLTHQRQETFRTLQGQARALPDMVEALQALATRIERRSEELDARLLERQAQFQQEVSRAYATLAQSVGEALEDNIAAGARAAGDAIRPVVEGAMAQVAQESQRVHDRLGALAQGQLDALSQQVAATTRTLSERWDSTLQDLGTGLAGEWRRAGDAALAQQQAVCAALEQATQRITESAGAQTARTVEQVTRLLEQSDALVRSRADTEARWMQQHGERMDQLAALWRTELAALRDEEARRGDAAVQRLGELQAAAAGHLATLGAALEQPITRLLHTAAEVPQAAAGVIAQLREEMHRVAERDNLALQERTALLERLGTLLAALETSSGEQRAAIDAMVASASAALERASDGFARALDAQAGQASDAAAQVAAGAQELGSLAEAFRASVERFQAGSDKLAESLQRVEASLQRSTARSDEQLAYYVAQAREVIDLSIASQQGVIESLRQLQARPARPVAVAEESRA